jgi:nicotine blue oxidoreductase
VSQPVPAAVVLAAGAGKRFGGPKALVRLDGELLVDRAIGVAWAAGCAPVVVVLGAAAGDVTRQARLDDAIVIVNDDYVTGIGSSLRCGLAALGDSGASAAVMLLVDQPRVGPQAVRRLIDAWRDGALAVVAAYGEQPRNPVLLDATTWPEVSASAHGDVGARDWLRAHADDVVLVACDDLGSDIDIDTPDDLRRLQHPEAHS